MDLKIEYVDIKTIKPYKGNAKTHPAEQIEQIKKSIEEFGNCDPIGIWNGEVVEGHGRLMALKEMGADTVPVIRLDHLTDEQRRAYALVHNKLTMNSPFDDGILSEELDNILDIDMSMFDLGDVFEPEPLTAIDDDFDIEPPAEPKAKRGDIYQLGNHRLMCGDSTNLDDVSMLMDNKKADIAFTSPPYNAGKSLSHNQNESKYLGDDDNKSSEDYFAFLVDFTNNSLKYADFSFVNIQSLANNKIALIDYLYELKNKYADTLVWDKGAITQPAMARKVLNSRFEYIHVFSHNGSRAIGTKDFRGTLDNVITIQAQRKNEFKKIHNASFPLEFAEYFVNNFCENSVLDLFGGTGSTLIACEQLKRKCYMMELEPAYVDVIISRWENYTGKKAVKL